MSKEGKTQYFAVFWFLFCKTLALEIYIWFLVLDCVGAYGTFTSKYPTVVRKVAELSKVSGKRLNSNSDYKTIWIF